MRHADVEMQLLDRLGDLGERAVGRFADG